ncbi:MAG: glycosyltransferase, partial [Candidatus Aminicenantes bacterium]|nr:glycosyltransferase [Candidatus Aminicenantes bacterium]NIR06545.1 glycosyltransferase [Candidatus Aminicenantes bacterium]
MDRKISISIITYNEEAKIGDALESVKWADEIVVVDSYSTDRTVEICRKYTD